MFVFTSVLFAPFTNQASIEYYLESVYKVVIFAVVCHSGLSGISFQEDSRRVSLAGMTAFL